MSRNTADGQRSPGTAVHGTPALPPVAARIGPDNRSGVEASQHVPGPAAFLGRGVVLAGAGLNLRMAKKT